MFLYVHHNSDDFQMYFPSFNCRQRFVDLLHQLRNGFADLDGNDEPDEFQVLFLCLIYLALCSRTTV